MRMFIIYLIISIITAGIIHYQYDSNRAYDRELMFPIEKIEDALSSFALGLMWPIWLTAIIIDLIAKFCKVIKK